MQLSYLPYDEIIKQFIRYKNKEGKLYNSSDRSKYEREIPLGLSYFKFDERGAIKLTTEMLKSFEEHLLNSGLSENTARNCRSHVNVFYKWLNEEYQYQQEKQEQKENVSMQTNYEQLENKPKKITFNIDRKKYIQLSCYALKYDMTLTDLYNEMTDDFLEKHFEEISSIKGVF